MTTNPDKNRLTDEGAFAFALEYTRSYNYAQAARAAGSIAMSVAGAGTTGRRWYTDPRVQSHIGILTAKALEARNNVEYSRDRVLAEFAKLAFVDYGELSNGWHDLIDLQELPADVRAAIKVVDTTVVKRNIGTRSEPDIVDVERVKIQLHDKIVALKALAEMLGYMIPEKDIHNAQGSAEGGAGRLTLEDLRGWSPEDLGTLRELVARNQSAKQEHDFLR